jgi:DNA-binding NtrC family response regulator
MESELFGHRKGAFTGAAENKKGLIEIADRGTAFFDEIGDLPLDLQVKLLRLLQEREFRSIGSLQRQKIDIRVIAATHRDIPAMINQGTFRQDLFYRLNIVTLRLTPLRERKQDIAVLLEHFLSRSGGRYTVTPEAKQSLMQYDWPGNVRELQNAAERMIAMADGPLLHLDHLPSTVRLSCRNDRVGTEFASAVVAGTHQSTASNQSALPPIMPLIEVERRAILRALEHAKGDRSKAAAMLQIGRTTLYRKLKDIGDRDSDLA